MRICHLSLLKAFRWIHPTCCSYLQLLPNGVHIRAQKQSTSSIFPASAANFYISHLEVWGLAPLRSSRPAWCLTLPALPACTAPPADHLPAGPFTMVQTQGDLPMVHQRRKQPSGTHLWAKDHRNPERCGTSCAALGYPRPGLLSARFSRCRSIDHKHRKTDALCLESRAVPVRSIFAMLCVKWRTLVWGSASSFLPINNGSLIYFLLS